MCGIAGYFSTKALDPARGRSLLERMSGALHHRGPDDRGLAVFEHCGIAATRLSIIDLEGGHMPISNEDGIVSVVNNGEIYNHRMLRPELEGRGHRFKTRSDTEVILHLVEDLGAEACARLSGMFAFAVWDQKHRRLLLGRDRFGIKPLMVASRGDLFLFASEAKAILASGEIEPELDPIALRDCFSCGYPMPPKTLFRSIEQLPPASWRMLEVGRGESSGRYWTMPYGDAGLEPRPSLERSAEQLRAVFDASVSDHLVADVSVGSYLSGGIDSVCVAARAARLTSAPPLHTYSMVFEGADADFDESSFSDPAAQRIGSEHRKLTLGGVSREDYEGTIRAMEAPQVHTVAFCLFQLSRLVQQAGQKVVLSGEGADELFAGYGVFRLSKLRRWFSGPFRPLRRLGLRAMLGRRQPELVRALLGWWQREGELATRYGLVPPWVEQWWILSEAITPLLSKDVRAMLATTALPELAVEPSWPSDPLQRDLRFEQATRLDGWVLPLGDRLTMAHSIEGRVPFLDPRIAELAARVSPRFLLRGFEEKALLRRAMRDAIPAELAARRKRAFMAPIARWLFGEKRPDFVRETLESPGHLMGLFDPGQIARQLEVAKSAGRSYAGLRAAWSLNVALGLVTFCRLFGIRP
jgi:asparagine synthase (glutamine-hydrolysing)